MLLKKGFTEKKITQLTNCKHIFLYNMEGNYKFAKIKYK